MESSANETQSSEHAADIVADRLRGLMNGIPYLWDAFSTIELLF